MSTRAKNLTFQPEILQLAEQLMELRRFGDNLSAFLSQLLREEWERRQSPMTFSAHQPTGSPTALQVAEELASRREHPSVAPPPHESEPQSAPYLKPSPKGRGRSSPKRFAKVRTKK